MQISKLPKEIELCSKKNRFPMKELSPIKPGVCVCMGGGGGWGGSQARTTSFQAVILDPLGCGPVKSPLLLARRTTQNARSDSVE